ncbi:hypothetical protein BGZ70_006658 [Mortierella alpina]|uniref:Triacylglycerol lipase n=1 Tax=Mortierella alpina TaxID=64518 RepID=A0A9P6J7Q1_MORAP|nr:hypothetical protein BGZ70_006658 [Mortierella alpina]
MKISLSSVFNAAVLVLTALSSSSEAAALPAVLEKRGISGINNFDCKLTPAHPRPLLLVHATLLNLDSWSTLAPYLIDEGYCVFALTYGRHNNIPIVGGLAPIENSAQELANFANNVLARMNASQLDYVGHSQGGILGRYWMKYLGGAGKVHRMVGIAPITHGTTLSGMATIAKALQIFDPSQPFFDGVAPSFFQMVESSDFMKKLNAGGDVAPGVIHSNIATRFDEVVTPWETCFQNGPGVTNVVLQDLCLLSLNEHLTIINSKVVLQFVLNQLSPATAKTANCLSIF